jgi:farnesyl-diphosphate farnesyltransferase
MEILNQDHTDKLLKLVSRSFALCIPRLPKKVRSEIGNFYLLCRYADSIEDSMLDFKQKKHYFRLFKRVIKNEDAVLLKNLGKEITPYIISDNDRKMVADFDKVLKQYALFDEKSKAIALHWVSEMMKGMQKYSRKEINNFLELDNYCYYVAGTVGHYLTEIFDHKFELNCYDELISRAKDFGMLLQKVNIIRDFTKDYKEGRVLWPKEVFEKHNITVEEVFLPENKEKSNLILQEMVESAEKNVKSSIEYIEKLPPELQGVRVFCAIPLYMAIPTLLKCYGNEEIFDMHKKVKLSRAETFRILARIDTKIGSNGFLKEYATELNNEYNSSMHLKIS